MTKEDVNILVGFLPEEYPGVEAFERLGNTTFLRYEYDWLLDNIYRFDVIVPHLFGKIDATLLENSKKLKILATPSTGSDHIDVEALKKHQITFISLNDDRDFINEIPSTAELSWLLTLACARKLPKLTDRVIKEKSWVNTDIRGMELAGKTIGIIGYGRLGKKVARYAEAFGMKILANDIDVNAFADDNINVEQSSLHHLLRESDIISLHVKLNPTSRNIIDEKAVSMMKNGVIIVNTARGGTIESEAILKGLESGKIASVGLDVLNNEYQSGKLPDDPLIEAAKTDQRIIITPHAGGSTYDAHSKVFHKIAELVKKSEAFHVSVK